MLRLSQRSLSKRIRSSFRLASKLEKPISRQQPSMTWLLTSSSSLSSRPLSLGFKGDTNLRFFHTSAVSREYFTSEKEPVVVQIGNVQRALNPTPGLSPHLTPVGYLQENPSQSVLSHLQWIMSKDNLGQDMLLVGPPGDGATFRRRIALQYAEMMQRPVEIVAISSDITESDLKQRRELTFDAEKNVAKVEFSDQPPVRAALHGRILILDGLETAERNVLPTLNNLLENREMHLEDGRCLVSPKRYSELKERGLDKSTSVLIPTHEDFRVIALATPAPPFPGRSLDPPLRSRFQIRRIENPSPDELYEHIIQSAGISEEVAKEYAAFAGSMENYSMQSTALGSSSRTLMFPCNGIQTTAKVAQTFPLEETTSLLSRNYPFAISLQSHSQSVDSFWLAYDNNFKNQKSKDQYNLHSSKYEIETISRNVDNPHLADILFRAPSDQIVQITVDCGMNELNLMSSRFIHTMGSKEVLKAMIQEHYVNRDLLLTGKKGEGKTATAMEFANILGYKTHLFGLYKDMTSRDLLMRRTTNSATGETVWEESPLLKAAVHGDLCILDGVDKLSKDTLATLQSLVHDREISLPDGRRLIRADRFEAARKLYPDHAYDSVISHQKSAIIPIPHSFRIIALGCLQKENANWISENVMSMFSTINIQSPSDSCLRGILKSANSSCPETEMAKILKFNKSLTEEAALDCGVSPLSTRNLIRIAKQVQPVAGIDLGLHEIISSVLMSELLPPTQKEALDALLERSGIRPGDTVSFHDEKILVDGDHIHIGAFSMKRGTPKRREMVPAPVFFDIPQHVHTIANLLKEWQVGERAFLLIGNQGVGKNKIVDRLCELANFEREYMQLHRDSTVGQLTLSPSLEDGKIVWKDSPLVRAVQEGCSLVIDEADKAPLETVSILKNLIEDGELLLADGRRISRSSRTPDTISIHPNFTVWILANRPGFPFHGNDFFREVGDCLSAHAIPNPDAKSEMKLLRSYAPGVDETILEKIVKSFDELRYLSESGELSYPYSTREAVSVVKHLQVHPGLTSALHNVLDMDSFDNRLYEKLCNVFIRNGIALEGQNTWFTSQTQGREENRERLSILYSGHDHDEGKSPNPPELSEPKAGKWDDENEAHVGGNQWQGGTGGSDTAGLGGRGGPWRLDRGHKVHQVSDQAKAQVSKEAAAAARKMAETALKERLEEIGMSETDWRMYDDLVEPIRGDIRNLRGLLKSVESTKQERKWIKRQSHGEIDDSRIVDGATGEKHIFKRRGFSDPDAGSGLTHRKRIRFVMDCSASMYRFNGWDERLNRSLEAAALIMESFEGMESQFSYSIIGHSGDSNCIKFIDFGEPPKSEKERMRVLKSMVAHTQYCQSGDNTLQAIEKALVDVISVDATANDETEECFVIGISDANLYRYGIRPRDLGAVMRGQSLNSVGSTTIPKAFCIFIASFGDEAAEIKRELPLGRGFVCNNTKELPRIVKDILSSLA